ncbi:MAG TPA: hypothetical protein VF173_06815 [Thermoanaerobaculia bacterium]|nr:hypothetical protein [Thermoanaerobaculia bacterium]
MDKVRVALKTCLLLLALVVTALAAMPDTASSQTNCCVDRDCFGGRFACGTCTQSGTVIHCSTSIR